MSFRRRMKGKRPPEGWDLIESSIEDFESQMRDAVAEEHEGKRKNELTWRIHRVHWEKNRFLFDLRYKRGALSQELYDYLCREKIADQALISKWRKPGYENLCSLLSIQKSDTNFGTASICRVPIASRWDSDNGELVCPVASKRTWFHIKKKKKKLKTRISQLVSRGNNLTRLCEIRLVPLRRGPRSSSSRLTSARGASAA